MQLRVVLDSNVIISGFLFGGLPGALIAHAVAGSVRCFSSLPILDEVREVLQRPKFALSPDQALSLIEQLHALFEFVTPRQRIHAIPADPDDNAVLEFAVAANADFIVTGDSHLLDLQEWKSIRIVTPAVAWREIESLGQE